ncbi:hypothetical protein PTKIN_Ptkin09bG0087200 [Pterospermum kingtungense]
MHFGGVSKDMMSSVTAHHHLGLTPIKVRKGGDDHEGEGSHGGGDDEEHQAEPLSPMARMFHEPESNVYIVVLVGFKSPIDPHSFKANLAQTLLKHPRFSSVQAADEKNGGELKWVETKVDTDNHVIVPMVDQDWTCNSSDKFVEDYVANLTKTKISMSIPMWDCHILNLKTSDAESTLVIRVHHSLGDGTSLTTLLISCSRKVSDPDALPSFPAAKNPRSSSEWFFKKVPLVLLLIWNTFVDVWMSVATTYFLNDTQTPLKAPPSVSFTSRRIVRRSFSLDDIKLVKNATNTTVNDVMVALTQAGLSRYLNRKYGEINKSKEEGRIIRKNNLPKNIRLRATLFFNLRSSPGIYDFAEMVKKNSKFEWGNKIGYALFPFTIELKDNPLDYIREAKAKMDRKKATLEPKFRLLMAKFFMRFYRTKVANFPYTTMWFSNVMGPQEEISILGNQVSYVAPSLYGQPVGLTIHVVSYGTKMNMVVSVDEKIVPDPHQLCDDVERSLQLIKNSVIAQPNTSHL